MDLKPTEPLSTAWPAATQTPALMPAEREELAPILAARVHVDVALPRTENKGRMRLLSRREVTEALVTTRSMLRAVDLPVEPVELAAEGLGNEWNVELAAAYLSVAVRRPDNESIPLMSVAQWREYYDDDAIAFVWSQY